MLNRFRDAVVAGTSHVKISPLMHSPLPLTVCELQIVPDLLPPLTHRTCGTLPVPFGCHRFSLANSPSCERCTPAQTLDLDHIRHRSARGPPRCVYTMANR